MSTRAQKRLANAAAAKQRRMTVIAFGGLGVLVILLAIQGPKLFGGSDDTPAALPVIPAVPAPPTSEPGNSGRALRFLKATGVDPFAKRSLADNDSQVAAVAGPAGTHDPFVQGGSSAAIPSPSAKPAPAPVVQLPKRIVVGTPTPGAVAKRGWIVVLASIQTRVGRAFAERFAARVRRDGLESVSVLNSSTSRPLRSGYWVVYTGPFASLSEVQRSAAHVRAFGYRTAYVREILRY